MNWLKRAWAWLRGETRTLDAALHDEFHDITDSILARRDALLDYIERAGKQATDLREEAAAKVRAAEGHETAIGQADTLAHNIGKLLEEKL